jgi:hypothetical protein
MEMVYKGLGLWKTSLTLVPAIAVVGFAQMDPRGALIRVLPEVSFGQVTVGTMVSTEYVFTNLTGEVVTINTVGFDDFVTIHSQDPPHPARAIFEVTGLILPTTLERGGQFRFTIRFGPPAEGTFRPRNELIVCIRTATTRQHIHYYIPLVGQGVALPGVTPGVFTLHPLQDAKIWQFRRTMNFGAESDLVVAPSASGYVINNESRTLIQFDLMQIPAGTSVAKATLRLCIWEYHGDPMVISLYRITQAWQEDTVTWDNHSSHYDYRFEVARTTLQPPLEMGSWVEFDVTTDVRNALAIGSPHHGWMLIAGAGPYAKFTSVGFSSREGGVPNPFAVPGTSPATDRRPQLVITTGLVPPTGPQIIDQTMCKDVQETSPYDPIGRTNTFTTDDRKAVSWVKLGPIDDVCRVDWEWYAPTGERYHTYTMLIPHPRTGGRTRWDWYVVWSEIYIRGTIVAWIPSGQWEVRIYVNRNLVLSQRFTIAR